MKKRAWQHGRPVPSLAGLLCALLLGGCAGEQGLAAYRQGDYAEALREFRQEGDPTGDFAVGVMHYKGEGVARDPEEYLQKLCANSSTDAKL